MTKPNKSEDLSTIRDDEAAVKQGAKPKPSRSGESLQRQLEKFAESSRNGRSGEK